jgi:hypothetical protein
LTITFLKPRAQYLKTLAEDYKLFVNRFYLSIHCSAEKLQKKELVKEWLDRWLKKDGWKVKQTDKAMSNIDRRVSLVLEISDLLFQMLNDVGASAKFFFKKEDYYSLWQQFTRPSKYKLETEVPDSTASSGMRKVKGIIPIDDKVE